MGEEIKMLTVEQRKRLDELELLDDVGGLSQVQREERQKLNEAMRHYHHECSSALLDGLTAGVDVLAVIRTAIEVCGGDPETFKCDARKAVEGIK